MRLVRINKISVLIISGVVAIGQARDGQDTYEIFAGSRGDGVPELARLRLEKIDDYLANRKAEIPGSIEFKKSRIGLEGEVVLCIKLMRDAHHDKTLMHLQSMTTSVPMLSLRTSTTCRAS